MMNIRPDIALSLIDIERYPIADISQGDGAVFLKQCQQQMDEQGWCNFDGFIHTEALDRLNNEANALLPQAQRLMVKRTIYQTKVDAATAKDNMRQREYMHCALQLADDQIPSSTLLQQLYCSELLTDFVRQVQRASQLYRCADEFQALNIVALEKGNRHAWHYDTTECTVTLLLQASESGGEFTFLPNSRTDDSEDYEAVEQVLSGDLSKAQSFSRGAGAFTLFRGGYSLHGVTEVGGDLPRISAIMTYTDQPNVVIADDINIRIYGLRVEKILAERQI